MDMMTSSSHVLDFVLLPLAATAAAIFVDCSW